jgi:GAF domain-containing protein
MLDRDDLYIVKDTTDDPLFRTRPFVIREKIRSCVAIPLVASGQKVGVMFVNYRTSHHFDADEVAIIKLFANFAAVAVQNAQHHELTRLEQERLERLHGAAQKMAGASELKALLPTVVEQARTVLGADSAVLCTYEPQQKRFIPDEPTASGISPEDLRRIAEEKSILQVALSTTENDLVEVSGDSARDADRQLSQKGKKELKRIGVEAFQGIALRVGDDVVGALFVNYRQPRAFSDEDRRLLRSFAGYAALALKKSRLFRQVKTAQRVAEIVAYVTAQGDKEAVLLSVARGTYAAVGCDVVVLYVYDQETGRLEIPPTIYDEPSPDAKALRRNKEVSRDSVVYKILESKRSYTIESFSNPSVPSFFKNSGFVRREGIKSCVAIPLFTSERKVGVMFVNYRTPHSFTNDERSSIQLFADQAAVVISNTQVFEELKKRANELKVLYEAGQAVTRSLQVEATLEAVTRQALRLIGGKGCVSSVALLKKDGHLDFVSASSEEIEGEHNGHPPESVPGRKLLSVGMARQAAKDGKVFNVGDLDKNRRYKPAIPGVRSQLSVPLRMGNEKIGALSIGRREPGRFSDADQLNVELLAAQAAVAIQNALQFKELEETKGKVGSYTALAWMGMTSNVWRHAIQSHAAKISNILTILHEEFEHEELTKRQRGLLERRLQFIERQAESILEKEIAPPLSPSEGVKLIHVNDFIRDRLRQLDGSDFFPADFEAKTELSKSELYIRCSRNWLRQAFDILVENAVEATEGMPVRRLTISTRAADGEIEIAFRDTGKGIPEEIRNILFKKRIQNRETKGLGMGLLMVQTIVQTYDAEIRVAEPGPEGTTMLMRFPAFREER